MTLITYKDLEGNEVPRKEDYFSGYEIKSDYSKPSSIIEYSNGEHVGKIVFRPTKLPVIFSVNYGSYREERYSHGGISAVYILNTKGELCGEYKRYDTKGVLTEIRYWNNGAEVTDDIKKFINFKGTKEDFLEYTLGEDERFNLWMQYGTNFKFIHEYPYDPSTFNEIVKYCLN